MLDTTRLAKNAQSMPPVFSHPEILRVMWGVMICIFLAALDQTAIIPALPAIASDLGTYTQLSWVVAAYLITSTISTPVYGKLSDIYGRRRLLAICLSVFITASVLCGLARSLDQLIWFRAIQGCGGGGLMALTQAAIADVVSPRERGRYQGYISAVWALASLSGPIVGGIIAQSLSWRWIFWVNLPIGLVAMWVCHRGLRGLSSPVLSSKPKLDIIGMLLLTGGLLLLLLGLGWGGKLYSWASYEIIGLMSLGSMFIFLLVFQEMRAHDPLFPPSIFRNSTYIANLIVSTFTALLLFMCLFTIPLYFQLCRGMTAAQSGMYIAPFMIASAFGNVAGSRWGRYFGAMRACMRISTALSCLGLLLFALLSLDTPLWGVVAVLVMLGIGSGTSMICSITNSQNALSPTNMGTGTSALLLLRSVGGAAGSTLAGAIIAAGLMSSRPGLDTSALTPEILLDHSATLAGVSSMSEGLSSSFQMVFLAASALAAISFIVTLFMPNTPLRETVHAPAIYE
ncbi:MDR family MFS transporter [Afipia felis]